MNSPARTTSTTAIVSLVFGIICWVAIPIIGAIVAIVCGHAARTEIRGATGRSPSALDAMDGRERPPPGSIEGDGMAIAGLILGYLHLALVAAMVLLVFTFLGGLAFFAHVFH